MSLLTSRRIADHHKNAAQAAVAEHKAVATENSRRPDVATLFAALAPLGDVVDVTKQRADLDAARQRLDDLRDAARRVEAAIDEDLVTDDESSPRITRRRARLETLRADIDAAEKAVAEAEGALRTDAFAQLEAIRASGLRAVSTEALEGLVADEAKEALKAYRMVAALAAKASAKVKALRTDVEHARLATAALVDLGLVEPRHCDARMLRDLGETDARRALGRAVFNGFRAGEGRDVHMWLASQVDYGTHDIFSKAPLPKRRDDERAETPKYVVGRHI
jgi:hypothetical protein